MMTTTLYWRLVQVLDEYWQLELNDPTFKVSLVDSECHDEIDGRRPLAHLWMWSSAKANAKPWRACIEGVAYSNRDYSTRDAAMSWTVKRACKEHGIQEYTLEGAQSDPS